MYIVAAGHRSHSKHDWMKNAQEGKEVEESTETRGADEGTGKVLVKHGKNVLSEGEVDVTDVFFCFGFGKPQQFQTRNLEK